MVVPSAAPGWPWTAFPGHRERAHNRTPGSHQYAFLLFSRLLAVVLVLAVSALPRGWCSSRAGGALHSASSRKPKPPTAAAELFVRRVPTPAEAARLYTHGLYEPRVGCYLGAFVDFDAKLPQSLTDQNGTQHRSSAAFETSAGKPHAMYFFYMGYGRPLPLDWVRHLAQEGKFVHIALEPNSGLDRVRDDHYLRSLALDMRRSGARIFLRFASEMNGNWTTYHRDPALYRAKFRLVHAVIRALAPNVALVWCPYMSPTDNIASYYPGDAGTDWVGVNLYNVTYHNNEISSPAENEHPCDLLNFVYNRYAARRPFMICEFAASHYAACEGRLRNRWAARKIETLYAALPRLYPRVKCINYFDGNNLQFVRDRAYNDYSVTDDTVVNGAYRAAISSPYFLGSYTPPNAAPVPMPLPLRDGQKLQGVVRLSCWARAPSDRLSIRYLVDGHPIYHASSPSRWPCDWNSAGVPPGTHTLSLEVRNAAGDLVCSCAVRVVTDR